MIECTRGNYSGFSINITYSNEFYESEFHELGIGRAEIKKRIYISVDNPHAYAELHKNINNMNEIKNLFIFLSTLKKPPVLDIWEVCLDLLCENGIGFPTIDWIPNLPEQFNQKKYTEALEILKILQSYNYVAPIWLVCKMLDDNLCKGEKLPDYFTIGQFNFETLVEWYQEITETNPNYKQANYRLYHIYLMSLEKQDLSQNDKENLFRFAVRSGDQELKDKAYNSLCNSDLNIKIFNNVQVNEETVVNAGHHIASLYLQIEALKAEITQLKQKPKNDTNSIRIYENSTQVLMPSPRQKPTIIGIENKEQEYDLSSCSKS